MTAHRIAILYQALEPPVIDGLRKDAKPGGYSDSGADIGFALRTAGHKIITPVANPDPATALDWVWPDTPEGIDAALAAGATLLWANTVLFTGHPVEAAAKRAWIVGQSPAATQAMDDKLSTNDLLRNAGLPVATARLATLETLGDPGLPIVIKPVRGRGSQGVSVTRTPEQFHTQARALIESGRFGHTITLEQFLPGTEITVPVMPGGHALAPVRRFGQINDIAPYNGDVPVSANSIAMTEEERANPEVIAAIADCEGAARLLNIRAPIRIDCRADATGRYVLFDLNAKPNITGAGRPGRDAEDSLSAIGARAIGWDYTRLLEETLKTAWTEQPSSSA